ncbi:hypothetical protein HPB50_020000 [Hyalomma asiaticum]|uniref:Uncharacterized protein n=1 Tax=Hyalomma asiaticum TaxID=266040 RepID=A0ACB7RJT4_HYAAI|nr:hypothetical protein HPB50_020000 [Hyalomma asiaticum]
MGRPHIHERPAAPFPCLIGSLDPVHSLAMCPRSWQQNSVLHCGLSPEMEQPRTAGFGSPHYQRIRYDERHLLHRIRSEGVPSRGCRVVVQHRLPVLPCLSSHVHPLAAAKAAPVECCR